MSRLISSLWDFISVTSFWYGCMNTAQPSPILEQGEGWAGGERKGSSASQAVEGFFYN